MADRPRSALESFYEFLWPSLETDNEARFAFLDRDSGGRSADDFMIEVAVERGAGAASVVLDAGCGRGKQVCRLAKELRCEVIALDALERNLAQARDRAAREQVVDRVRFVRGSIEAIPLPDASVDLVWCRDMMNHVPRMDAALGECARVLRPGGFMVNCSALATDFLEPREALAVCRPMGLAVDTLSRTGFEEACGRAGLAVVESGSMWHEGSRFLEALNGDEGRNMQRLGGLLRAPSLHADLLAEEHREILVALYRWNAFLLIGKITYHLWVLQKGASSALSC
jgi:SAM-dependent methyltransferase